MNYLLIDENLPASLAEILPIACSHATDLGVRCTDLQLWQHARDGDGIILTRDADFFDRLTIDGPPPKVIWVRLGNIRRKDLESRICQFWQRMMEMLSTADLVEMHPNSLEAFHFDPR